MTEYSVFNVMNHEETSVNHDSNSMILAQLLNVNSEDLPALATVEEWLALLDKSEIEHGFSILTKLQKHSVLQMGAGFGNTHVEMDARDFLALIKRLRQEAASEASYQSDTGSVDGSLAVGDNVPTMNNSNHMNLHHRNTKTSLSPAPQPPRPAASSSLDHRQRTSELLNQVHARLRRITDHSQDSDNDDHRISPSVGHPSLSPSSSTMDLYTDYTHQKQHQNHKQHRQQQQMEQEKQKQRAMVTFSSPKKERRKSVESERGGSLLNMPDIGPNTSFSEPHHLGLASNKRLQERLEAITQEYDERIAQMEVMLGDMRHETILYKRAVSESKATEKEREKQITELEQRLEEMTLKASKQALHMENLRGELKLQTDSGKHLRELLAEKENELKHTERKYEQLENEIKVYQKEFEQMSQIHEQLANDMKDADSLELQIEALTIENSRLKNIIDDLKADSEVPGQGLVQGLKPLQTLDAELANSMDDFNVIDPRVDQLQRECDLYKAKAEEAFKEMDKVKSILARSDQLGKEVEKYKLETQKAYAKLVKFEMLCAQLQEENEKLTQYANELEQGLHDPPLQENAPTTADIAVQCDKMEAGSPETCKTIQRLKNEIRVYEETVKRLKRQGGNKSMDMQTKITNAMKVLAVVFFGFRLLTLLIGSLFSSSTYGLADTPLESLYPSVQCSSCCALTDVFQGWWKWLSVPDESYFIPH